MTHHPFNYSVSKIIAAKARLFGLVLFLVISPCATILAAPGDLDTTFGANGVVSSNFGGLCHAYAVAVQVDGRIVVAGDAHSQAAVARYNTDGSLDPTFGSAGVTITPAGELAAAFAVAIQPDGRIVVAGQVHFNTIAYDDWLILRYNTDGSLDNTFGSGGMINTDFGTFDFAYAVQIQPDDKIIVAGRANDQFGVARYDPDGSLDASFAEGGKTIIEPFRDPAWANSIALTSGGQIVVAGYAFSPTDEEAFGLVMFKPKGALAKTFGHTGEVIAPPFQFCMPGDPNSEDIAQGVAIQADGKIVAAGNSLSPCGPTLGDFAVARYLANGALDPTFGSGGQVATPFLGAGAGKSLVIQPDGKILVGGQVLEFMVGYEFGLIRYNSDGSLDPTFGFEGRARTFFGDINYEAGSMALGRDGNIIGVGAAFGSFELARYQTGIPVPEITSVSVHGKTLTVTGANFDKGATILLNGSFEKTHNDSANPTSVLVSPKAGKLVEPGDTVTIMDTSGLLSAPFTFTGQ